jgi:hypothetical protein
MVAEPEEVKQQKGMVVNTKQLLASFAFVLYAKANITLKIGVHCCGTVSVWFHKEYVKFENNSFFYDGCKEL